MAGIVLIAFGVETTLHHLDSSLDLIAAVALCGGPAIYLVAHVAFLFRATGHIFRRRATGTAVLLSIVRLALIVPAAATLGLVGAICWLVVADEAIRHREDRSRVRQIGGRP